MLQKMKHIAGDPCEAEESSPMIYVLDADACVREDICRLLCSVGYRVEPFDSAGALLSDKLAGDPCCLVTEARLSDQCGLALQDQFIAARASVPFVFMTSQGDISMSVRAMKAGAIDFLEKPFRDQQLLEAVSGAVARNAERRKAARALEALRKAHSRLSPREKQVMSLVVAGNTNKGIGAVLGISLVTVKIHRRAVMDKMQTRTLAALVLKANTLGIVSLASPCSIADSRFHLSVRQQIPSRHRQPSNIEA